MILKKSVKSEDCNCMGQKEENWNIALRKAAHKNAMQHVQQPLVNKDGVKEVEETFISGAVCAKYILANKLGGAELKMHKEKMHK